MSSDFFFGQGNRVNQTEFQFPFRAGNRVNQSEFGSPFMVGKRVNQSELRSPFRVGNGLNQSEFGSPFRMGNRVNGSKTKQYLFLQHSGHLSQRPVQSGHFVLRPGTGILGLKVLGHILHQLLQSVDVKVNTITAFKSTFSYQAGTFS